MAGRGRGQPFQAISDGLGIGRGQINQQHVDPPPIYPPLGSRPHYPQMLPENEYMLAVMKDFTNNMRDSQFAISACDKDNLSKGIVIERHSDKPLVSSVRIQIELLKLIVHYTNLINKIHYYLVTI